MTRILSAVLLLLQFCSAYAVTEPPPAEGADAVGTIVFAVLFFGFCFGFIWMVWKNDKKPKQEPEPWKD